MSMLTSAATSNRDSLTSGLVKSEESEQKWSPVSKCVTMRSCMKTENPDSFHANNPGKEYALETSSSMHHRVIALSPAGLKKYTIVGRYNANKCFKLTLCHVSKGTITHRGRHHRLNLRQAVLYMPWQGPLCHT